MPDLLSEVSISLDAATLADLSDAERGIVTLNAGPVVSSRRLAALAEFLLRAEAVGSSWIEGLVVGSARLARAEALHEAGRPVVDRTAAEIVGNITAMREAVDTVANRKRIAREDILTIHRALLVGTPNGHLAGVVRTSQNWIGGSGYNPCAAEFVPPPPEELSRLLDDLVAYVNLDDVPPLLQAAFVHAQFETIHPFADGNGRTGRALVHVVLKRRGLAPAYVPPISLILATRKDAYIAGLRAFGYDGPPNGEAAAAGVRHWVGVFAAAATRAAAAASRLDRHLESLAVDWRRAAAVRARSAADLLLDALPGTPVLTVAAAARLIGRSEVAANAAMTRLVDAGVLTPVDRHRWGRVFEARDILDALTWFERSAASLTGETASSPPARPVPARRVSRPRAPEGPEHRG